MCCQHRVTNNQLFLSLPLPAFPWQHTCPTLKQRPCLFCPSLSLAGRKTWSFLRSSFGFHLPHVFFTACSQLSFLLSLILRQQSDSSFFDLNLLPQHSFSSYFIVKRSLVIGQRSLSIYFPEVSWIYRTWVAYICNMASEVQQDPLCISV